MAINRSIETQQMLKVVAAVAWIHNTTITSINKVWSDGRIKHLVASHTGSTKIPTEKSATDSDAKKLLEIVRKDSSLKNSHNTIAFPVIATKLDKENHTDKQMDAALLRCLSGWLSFIVRWCTAAAKKKKVNLGILKIFFSSLLTNVIETELILHESSYSFYAVMLFIDRHVVFIWSLKTENGKRCEMDTTTALWEMFRNSCLYLSLTLPFSNDKKGTRLISFKFKSLAITDNKVFLTYSCFSDRKLFDKVPNSGYPSLTAPD